ncbi:MAG TPA: hypothetical protein VF469_20750 [Kofleriaceae bacterium]
MVDDPERELASHHVRIWALDLACLADREFWSDQVRRQRRRFAGVPR